MRSRQHSLSLRGGLVGEPFSRSGPQSTVRLLLGTAPGCIQHTHSLVANNKLAATLGDRLHPVVIPPVER